MTGLSETYNIFRTSRIRRIFFAYVYLLFVLLIPLNSKELPYQWNGISKIIAIADLHGDFDNFLVILKGVGLVDENLHWIGGKTHLVQTGDIMDRGPEARNILDLVMNLEKEAESAGGMVHVLLGNHEEANIVGTALDSAGYVSHEQFLAFLPDKFREIREKKIRTNLSLESNDGAFFEHDRRMAWVKTQKEDPRARSLYMSNFQKEYGKWLLTKNVVIKINDIIFTHGGINLNYSKWKLIKINQSYRNELKNLVQRLMITRVIAYIPSAPQWFRGLIQNDEEDYLEEVKLILKNLNATNIVIGHTVRQGVSIDADELPRFEGLVWGIDTGISESYGGHLSALIIEDGIFKVWRNKHEN